MVTLGSLWLPILLGTVIVFFASAVVWTMLPHHKKDWAGLANEDALMAGLRGAGVTPGQYMFPFTAHRKDPEWARKAEEGPVGFLLVGPPGMPTMGKKLILQFLYQLAVVFVVAYLASRTVPAGADYLGVFRVTGTAAFLAFSGAHLPSAIWFARSWRMAWLEVFDGLFYALLLAGVFGSMWPA